MTRVPETVADRVRAEAEARDMSYSEYIAAILGDAHGFTIDIPARRTDIPEQGHLEGIGA